VKSAELQRIAVVIPAYCAARTVGAVLDRIPDCVALVFVVDDGSPDATADVVLKRQARDGRIRLLRHAVNQGVGAAVLTGYRAALEERASAVVKIDSDGQMDPALVPLLVRPLLRGTADYVKANRFLHRRQLQTMPPLRRLGNLGLSFLTKLASGYWNIFDPTNGYTAIHGALLPLVCEAELAPRFFFETSLLLELSLLRAVVRDVAIPARYEGQPSHLSEWRALVEFPPRLLRGFVRRLWTQYFVRDFGLSSLFMLGGGALLAFGALFGGYHWLESLRTAIARPTGTVMLAVLPVILGIQLLLQAAVLDVQGVPDRPLHDELQEAWPGDAAGAGSAGAPAVEPPASRAA